MSYFQLCVLPSEESYNVVFTIPPVGQLIGKSLQLTYDKCETQFPFRHLCIQSLEDGVKINQHVTFDQDNANGELGNILSNSLRKIPLQYTGGFKLIYFLKKDLIEQPENVKLTYFIDTSELASDVVECDTDTLYCFDIVSGITGRRSGYDMKRVPAKMTFRKDKTADAVVEEWVLKQYQYEYATERRRIKNLLPRNPFNL